MHEELHDIISDCVCEQLAEWGTTAKVSEWQGEENFPLRIVMNQRCGPLIDDLYKNLIDFLEKNYAKVN